MMKLLAIETALFQCSIALLHNGKISSLETDQPSQQSTQLFPLMNKLLEQNSIKLTDIDVIACTVGPGSFTGVRIGIAAVRAISKIIPDIKLLGISTLELVAYAARNTYNNNIVLIAIIEAGRDEFYIQKFDHTIKPLSEIILTTKEQLHQQLQPNEIIISNKDMPVTASLVLERALELLKLDVIHGAIHPLYIKAPSITKQKNAINRYESD